MVSYNKISKKEVIKDLTDEKQEMYLLNKNLKGERNIIKLKYSKSKNELNQKLSNLKTELNILQNRNFIFKNALIEKESVIKKIKNDIKILAKASYPLIKEEDKEIFLNDIESESIFNELYASNIIIPHGDKIIKYKNDELIILGLNYLKLITV